MAAARYMGMKFARSYGPADQPGTGTSCQQNQIADLPRPAPSADPPAARSSPVPRFHNGLTDAGPANGPNLLFELTMRLFHARPFAPALCLALVLVASLGVPSARAQDYNETMSALSAQAFHDDVQRRIRAGTSGDGPRTYLSGYEPETPEQQAALDAHIAEMDFRRRLAEDPELARYANGWWEFYQAREPAEPGEYCAGSYRSHEGVITLTGHDKTWDGGMLLFTGARIARPAAVEQVSATLSQTGDPPATVPVFIFAADPAMEGFGTIGFAVPSIPDALRGMIDKSEFAIAIEGQEVFRMSWKDGIAARNALRRCIRPR